MKCIGQNNDSIKESGQGMIPAFWTGMMLRPFSAFSCFRTADARLPFPSRLARLRRPARGQLLQVLPDLLCRKDSQEFFCW